MSLTCQSCLCYMYVHIRLYDFHCTNLLYGAFFSRGLCGLVAMLASSASQLVLGEQLSSWWDTPAPTWNNPGDLWSSSTSCSSGMSSVGEVNGNNYKEYVEGGGESLFLCFKDFTIIHVTPRWGRQVLVTLQRIKGLVHFHKFLSFPLSFLVLKQAPGQFIWLPSSYPATLASYRQKTKIRAFTNKIIKKNC